LIYLIFLNNYVKLFGFDGVFSNVEMSPSRKGQVYAKTLDATTVPSIYLKVLNKFFYHSIVPFPEFV